MAVASWVAALRMGEAVVSFIYWETPKRKRETMNNERETCGICSQDYLVKNTKDHQCPDENIYTISLTFTTDRPLSEIELETLKMQASAQIEEPVNSDGDDVDYTTNLIEIKGE